MKWNKRMMPALVAALVLSSSTAFAFSVDFAPGTPLVDALRALGYKSGKNVIINGELEGSISMHMDDTDFDTAMGALARSNNFSYE